MPEPPSHVEEPRVGGQGRELPEHVHICLRECVPLDIATRAEVLVQGPHPGCLVTNAQNGPVVGSCKDRGQRTSGRGHLTPGRQVEGMQYEAVDIGHLAGWQKAHDMKQRTCDVRQVGEGTQHEAEH